MDAYNHPRLRRAVILNELVRRKKAIKLVDQCSIDIAVITTGTITSTLEWMNLYDPVHSKGLLNFLASAWGRWDALGKDGQPPGFYIETNKADRVLVPGNVCLHRENFTQRPSQNVMGQMGYYCTDVDTPVFRDLMEELFMDGSLIETAVAKATIDTTPYVMVTHPGHHAAHDSFGGYCYVNHVAAMAKLIQTNRNAGASLTKVAILDIDYHVGNGTASIFYSDPSVLVVSIHCDPNFDYPFHSGFSDQTGKGEGLGSTVFLPLPPGTTWNKYSEEGLVPGLDAIRSFGAEVLIVSMGLDTHLNDPVALRRAGFALQGDDYLAMGQQISEFITPLQIPVIFLQEGGYKMDQIASAAANVLTGFCKGKSTTIERA